MPPATYFFSARQKKSKLINSTLKNQLEQWGPCMWRGRGVLQFQHHTPLSIGINDKVSGRVKIWEVVRCIALVNKSWVMMHITDPMTGPIIKSNKIHTSPHPEGLSNNIVLLFFCESYFLILERVRVLFFCTNQIVLYRKLRANFRIYIYIYIFFFYWNLLENFRRIIEILTTHRWFMWQVSLHKA